MKNPKLPPDELFEVERRIARRADELTRRFGSDPVHALDHWRQAEQEVWRDELAHEQAAEHTALCAVKS